MSAPDSPLDYIDYTSISFPSDKLTIRDLRLLYPHYFDVEGSAIRDFLAANAGQGKLNSVDDDWLASMLDSERWLARHSYDKSRGAPVSRLEEIGDSRDKCASELSTYYVHFGLASGPTHADQLIRQFEAAAAAQARPGPSASR
jgi:hypothetical protein